MRLFYPFPAFFMPNAMQAAREMVRQAKNAGSLMLKLYMDENIDRTIAQQLQQKGIDVLRCQEAGMLGATDDDHLILATAQGRTILTGDEDFLILDAEYRTSGKQHAGIAYIAPDKLKALGVIIKSLAFLYDAVTVGATDLETEVFNTIWRV